jgi:glutathione S-transferase
LRYAPEKIAYAIDRYTNESKRLCRVLDTHLADRPFVAGDYSISDMAIFPWVHAAEETVGGSTRRRMSPPDAGMRTGMGAAFRPLMRSSCSSGRVCSS